MLQDTVGWGPIISLGEWASVEAHIHKRVAANEVLEGLKGGWSKIPCSFYFLMISKNVVEVTHRRPSILIRDMSMTEEA